jgi:FkbM family methyltransferase
MAKGWRAPVLALARRAGLELRLRDTQERFESRMARRDRKDMEHLDVLLAAALPAHANCVDVGANIGDVLDRISRRFPAGRHIAFEPLPELAADLAARFPSVDVHHAALGAERGEATFYRNLRAEARSSLSTLGVPADQLEPVPVTVETLDEVAGDRYLPHFIKIDVEGAEASVLRGARRVLREARPLVLFEHGAAKSAYFGASSADVFAPLHEAGLRVFDIDGGGPYDREGFVGRARDDELWTWFAIP